MVDTEVMLAARREAWPDGADADVDAEFAGLNDPFTQEEFQN
jgi:hypothetical protein